MWRWGRSRKSSKSPIAVAPAPGWLQNEWAIYALAQREMRWLAKTTYDAFWHPEGTDYVTAWPVRLYVRVWWMPEPIRQPKTPAQLSAALKQFPPRREGWPCGDLVDDPDAQVCAPVQVLDHGTRVRSGRSCPDFCDGFDSQEAVVLSGPWAGTPVNLQIGRVGESSLIARLALMPDDEPLIADPAAAADLLRRLREVGRSRSR